MEREMYRDKLRRALDANTLSTIEPILERMPGGFFIYHADGNEELLYLNSAVLRIFGCQTDEEFRELTGFTFRGMVHPDDIEEIENSIRNQIASSIYDFDYVEYRIVQKDGSIRWIADYGHFLHTEAYGDIFYVFIDDNTERMKHYMTEQVQRQNLLESALSQAQTANIARNTFLQNMSHDIRTPLNVIIGYTELAKKHKMEQNKIENYLNQICAASEQLLSIVKASLEVTRIESGKVYLVENIVALDDLLADIECSIRPQVKAKAIHFAIDRSQVRHNVIYIDDIRMKEILFQLLDNALKYTQQGGLVRLTVIETEAKMSRYAQFVFTVEDNGRGIAQEFRKDLFQPFERERNTTKSGVLGTGLGLSVVKNLVELMDGSIEVESNVGQGSRFRIRLLLKVPEELSEENPILVDSDSSINLEGKRILLVEDNEINREIAQELLMDEGYLVETANDGSVAVEMIKNASPSYYSLVLMDIQMPVMDGYTATREIRALQDEKLARIPIIALSANAFAEDYKRSIEAGMDAHVPKPIQMEELQETIRHVLGRNKQA
ncbi:MAG: response regulator [Lachnospiraceae bacterium]|jgi:PAS domain S-box-containing protein|nr:response regulator [Lachnospiraceae bacterium]